MDTLQILDNYISVAEFLNDEKSKSLLNSFKNNLKDHSYYLPFFGQFSAGKSKLINHMLGFELLPTKTRETTAFLTYISYGDQNSAEIHYVDGTTESIDIMEVHNLDQDATKNSRPIVSLEIRLCNDLLKNGLIIVDTPGLNTLITQHVRMTEELLSMSQYAVYVLGKSYSATDLQLINQMEESNIPLIFVRTHVDTIHSTEESIFSTIKSEKESLEERLGRNIQYFAISNEESFKDEIVQEIFNSYMNHVKNEIATNLSNLYEESTKKRLEIVKSKFLAELNQRELNVKKASLFSLEQIKTQQSEIQNSKRIFERTLEKNSQLFLRKEANTKGIINDKLIQVSKERNETFANKLDEIVKTNSYHQDAVNLYKEEVPNTFREIGEIVSNQIQKLALESTDDVKSYISELSSNLSEIKVDLSCDFDLSKVESINEEQEAYELEIQNNLEKLQLLKDANDEELGKLGADKEQISKLLAEYDNVIKQANNEIKSFQDSHEVQYIMKESELGKKLKVAGQIADVAMLFISPAGWASVAKNVGHAANALSNGGKIAQLASKVLIKVGQGAKYMSKADKVLDASKVINAGQKTLKNPKKPTFLDHFSLSHWMAKFGEEIDPPMMVIDEDAEKEYQNVRTSMINEVNKKVQDKLQVMKDMGIITTDIQAKEKKQEFLDQEMEKMQEEQEKKKQEFAEKKTKKYYEEVKRQILNKFEHTISEYVSIINERSSEEVHNVIESILFAANRFVNEQLESTNAQFEELIKLKENNQKKDDEILAELQSIVSKLNVG